MFCSSSLVSCLYAASFLTTQLAANPVGSAPLSFQVEPTSQVSSFEGWPTDEPSQAEQPAPEALLPDTVFASGPSIQPNEVYDSLLPIPPFVGLFQSLLNSLSLLSPSSARPDHHHHHFEKPVDCTKYTIGEVLDWVLHHTDKPSSAPRSHGDCGNDAGAPPLHRLAWLVNVSSPVQEALNNPDADFTLFAPDDDALTPPKKRDGWMKNPFDQASRNYENTHLFWDALEALESMRDCRHMSLWTEGEDDEKERRKKFFLHAVEMVLKYHVSPGSKRIHEILDSSTLPTALPILPSPDATRFRIRVGPALPHHSKPGEIVLNFFTKLELLKYRPILTKNGVIYIVQKIPLLPPLSPLSEMFLFPRPFATLTTALQKVNLDSSMLPRWENKTVPLSVGAATPQSLVPSSALDGSMDLVDERVQSVVSSLTSGHSGKLSKSSFTIFAPTNRAFRTLGPAANAFLFSPFGQHILRYVLSYHIVPDVIWNTDHCERTKAGVPPMECDLDSQTREFDQFSAPIGLHPFPPLPGKVNVTELHLGTLLGSRRNESLPVTLVKFRHLGKGPTIRRVYIKSPRRDELGFGPPDKHAIPVVVADGVAWGGALHMIPKLVHPPVPEGHRKRKDVQRAIELSILSPA
ncbi:hypothetical protein PTTG_25766 [Puccinia triticina 1-1 BBBD Race 1]|uniref:FAS1 domain-containing protein n=2 Tax=Puccinia triticina TaxID=208348 RepID=A0A180GYU9_PUCT1|nr:uncharacterized protein PtA15_10A484 [Puccinia triticina]OAV98026.1 hypothetical protein PTTG_25766 [Puccinia triticina 1-1 BBBD Race 1]WAQ89061.1 hypothetical protein PtA15_10A484 [Puccinia triticina]WAR59123.1 hypothetical protein PtB15_10B465 [Puccinia triticina]